MAEGAAFIDCELGNALFANKVTIGTDLDGVVVLASVVFLAEGAPKFLGLGFSAACALAHCDIFIIRASTGISIDESNFIIFLFNKRLIAKSIAKYQE
jgi:hypothetical protein